MHFAIFFFFFSFSSFDNVGEACLKIEEEKKKTIKMITKQQK